MVIKFVRELSTFERDYRVILSREYESEFVPRVGDKVADQASASQVTEVQYDLETSLITVTLTPDRGFDEQEGLDETVKLYRFSGWIIEDTIVKAAR